MEMPEKEKIKKYKDMNTYLNNGKYFQLFHNAASFKLTFTFSNSLR